MRLVEAPESCMLGQERNSSGIRDNVESVPYPFSKPTPAMKEGPELTAVFSLISFLEMGQGCMTGSFCPDENSPISFGHSLNQVVTYGVEFREMGKGGESIQTSNYKTNKLWEYNIQHGDYSKYCIIYLKVAERRFLKFSHKTINVTVR